MGVYRHWYIPLGIGLLGWAVVLTVALSARDKTFVLMCATPFLFVGGLCGAGNIVDGWERRKERQRRVLNARRARRQLEAEVSPPVTYRTAIPIATRYQCPVCRKWHDTESAARWCADIDTAGG